MSCYDHTGASPWQVVAASVDVDLLQRRNRLGWRILAVQVEMARERQRVEDQRIVANREANVLLRRIAERVR